MTRQYSPRSFLRQASNELLARYFHERGLLEDVEIGGLSETEIEPVFEAWMALPAQRSAEVESDFAVVDLLADDLGMRALLDEAAFHDLDLVPDLEEWPGFHDKALWALLEHRTVVEVASRFCEADHLPYSYWARRRDAVPVVEPRDDKESCAELARTLASYFRLKEGRGRECHVDVYRRGERFFYFAFPEDYGRISLEYSAETLQRRAQRPVFEVIFAYEPGAGALDTFFRGPKDTRLELEKIFSRVILSADLEEAKDERVYDLNAFKNRGVRFVYDPASGIRGVSVKLLRLSLLGGGRRRVTLEADPREANNAIYDLMEEVFGSGANGASGGPSIILVNVTRVGIEVVFDRGGRRGRPTKTFYLTYPNGCTLRHDGRDAALRQMLIDSKIEAARPVPTPAAK